MNVLDVVIILAYFVGMIVLGLIANKKQTGVDDYYLGGRAMGALKIGALWMAGWIGGSSVIGTSSNSYSMGITGIWYVGEIAIGCVLFALVMAEPVKRVSEVLQNITFPEMIRARYDQKNSTMASITTILAMIGYTAAQFVAGASILNVLTGWDLGLCYVLAAVVIVFYVSTGGLLAVTYTDIVQMALLLLGVVFLAVPLVGSMMHKNGMSLAADLPASFFDLGAWGWPTIAALGLSTVMSFFTSMDSYTRCIAAKDARTARTGTIYAAVLVLIIAGASTFLGMAGKLILPDLASSNNVIAALVVELFPHGLKGLVLIGVLSAIMSTADISVLTGSASLTKDIYQRYFHPEASEKALMRVGLAASLLVGVLADKDYPDLIAQLDPYAAAYIAATPLSPRALPAEELGAYLQRFGKPVTVCPDPAQAAARALAQAGEDDVICAVGSLYMAGAIRTYLRREHDENSGH